MAAARAPTTASGPPRVRVRDVLAAIFDGCDGLLELRALPPKAQTFLEPTNAEAIKTFAVAHCREHVFFGVASRRDTSGGSRENCAHLGALFVDLDGHGDPAALAAADARLGAFAIPPSIVIGSGGGRHAYWLLREPADVRVDGASVRVVLRQLAVALGGDLASAECARVLRLPGTLNHKYAPSARVTVQTYEPDRRVNLSDFEFLPSEPVSVAPASAEALDLSDIGAGERNSTLYRLGRTLRAKGLPTAAITATLHATNATCRPPLEAGELDGIIRQVLTQPDRPDFAPASVTPEAAKEPASSGLTLTPLCALLAEPDEEEAWLVEGRIATGSINLLAGKPKCGKSTAVRGLALEIARGGHWLGFPCQQGTVWYLVLEDKRSEVKRHFRRMGGCGEPVRFLFDQPGDKLLAKLHALALAERPALIIIDTLQRLIKAKDLNDYAEITTKLTPILTLARETGAAVLLVHHAKKTGTGMDAVLGSTALTGSVDNVFSIERTDRYRVLASTQRIGDDLLPTTLTLDAQTGHVQFGVTQHEADRAVVEASILEALAAATEPQTEPELEQAVTGNTRLKRKALRQLVKDGAVRRAGGGKKNDPFTYTMLVPENTQNTQHAILVPEVANEHLATGRPDADAASRLLVPSYSREQENKHLKSPDTSMFTGANACSLVRAPGTLDPAGRERASDEHEVLDL